MSPKLDFSQVSHHHPAPSPQNLLRPGPTSNMKVNVWKREKIFLKYNQA